MILDKSKPIKHYNTIDKKTQGTDTEMLRDSTKNKKDELNTGSEKRITGNVLVNI